MLPFIKADLTFIKIDFKNNINCEIFIKLALSFIKLLIKLSNISILFIKVVFSFIKLDIETKPISILFIKLPFDFINLLSIFIKQGLFTDYYRIVLYKADVKLYKTRYLFTSISPKFYKTRFLQK